MACPTGPPAGTSGATTGSLSLLPRSRTGARRGGKKGGGAGWARSCVGWPWGFFGVWGAADDLYEAPFCFLSGVNTRRYKRILYDVLDHDPTHDDIRTFLGRLKTALVARD